ncbi:MAG: cell division protein FtsK, partial [Gammaproteobacteria bacterium]
MVKKVKAQNKEPLKAEGYQTSRGLREAGFLISFAIAIFMLIALWTFDKGDPGWSQYSGETAISNAGGSVGAWMADLLLYLFGLLAYLLPIMIGYHGWLLLRGLFRHSSPNVWVFLLRWGGFFVTLITGTGLIYLHFPSGNATLPGSAGGGGVLGLEVGEALLGSFGLTGSTLLLSALFLAGVTLFTGMSWFSLMDLTGKITLSFIDWIMGYFHLFLDHFASRRAQKARTATFKKEKERTKGRQPPKIEPIFKAIEISERVEKEKQVVLFDTPEKGDLPPISLLDDVTTESTGFSNESLEAMSKQLELKLKDFGVEVEVVAVHPGPVITRFELQPAPGVKASRITGLSQDLARALSTHSVRVVEVIPGKSVIGLEIPNESREMVHFQEIIASRAFEQSPSMLTLALGKDISGSPVVSDLAK